MEKSAMDKVEEWRPLSSTYRICSTDSALTCCSDAQRTADKLNPQVPTHK
jgi:hypothetical protein